MGTFPPHLHSHRKKNMSDPSYQRRKEQKDRTEQNRREENRREERDCRFERGKDFICDRPSDSTYWCTPELATLILAARVIFLQEKVRIVLVYHSTLNTRSCVFRTSIMLPSSSFRWKKAKQQGQKQPINHNTARLVREAACTTQQPH